MLGEGGVKEVLWGGGVINHSLQKLDQHFVRKESNEESKTSTILYWD